MVLVWKLNSIVNADSKDLSEIGKDKVTLTVTSPPYHNAINYQEHQSSTEWYRGTVGASLDSWIDEMRDVFSQVYKVTKPGGYCCIVIGNEIVEEKNKLPLPAILLVELTKKEIGWKGKLVFFFNNFISYHYAAISTRLCDLVKLRENISHLVYPTIKRCANSTPVPL